MPEKINHLKAFVTMLKRNIEAIYIPSTCVGVRQGVRVEACTCFKTIIGARNHAWFGLTFSIFIANFNSCSY